MRVGALAPVGGTGRVAGRRAIAVGEKVVGVERGPAKEVPATAMERVRA